MDSRTARLSLHAVDELEAQRIRDRAPQPGDAWAADYPFEGDLAATVGFLRATEQNGEQRPFGYYQIRLQSDGLAIGGVGFKGPPDGEVVEIGYGLAPSARGHGYAAAALGSLMQIAADLGVTTIRADTDLDNVASQRTLEHAGFHQVEADSSCITTRSVSAKCGRSRNALLRLRACVSQTKDPQATQLQMPSQPESPPPTAGVPAHPLLRCLTPWFGLHGCSGRAAVAGQILCSDARREGTASTSPTRAAGRPLSGRTCCTQRAAPWGRRPWAGWRYGDFGGAGRKRWLGLDQINVAVRRSCIHRLPGRTRRPRAVPRVGRERAAHGRSAATKWPRNRVRVALY